MPRSCGVCRQRLKVGLRSPGCGDQFRWPRRLHRRHYVLLWPPARVVCRYVFSNGAADQRRGRSIYRSPVPGDCRVLWLALHFPLLPLEALSLRPSPSTIDSTAGTGTTAPTVGISATETKAGTSAVVSRGRVLACDRLASEAGISAGQKLSTALGLQPGLAVFERDASRESAALTHLACWAGRFTPTVSLSPPAGLLLEIGG